MPTVAFGHASPTIFEPNPLSQTTTIDTISIKFTERPDQQISNIIIRDKNDNLLSSNKISPSDEHTLSVRLASQAFDTLVVRWFVVSKDDGHYTNGSYILNSKSQTHSLDEQEPIEHKSSIISNIGGLVEFAGAILLIIFLVLTILSKKVDSKQAILGFGLIAIGTLLTITSQLIEVGGLLENRSYLDFLSSNSFLILTSARLSVSLIGLLFIFGSRKLTLTSRVIFISIAVICLCTLRGLVSHASAQPFEPIISSVITGIHMLSKFTWLGLIIATNIFIYRKYKKKNLTDWLKIYLSQSQYLYIILVIASITGGYITWLHLKDLSNLFTTQWGLLMFFMLLCAGTLIILRFFIIYLAKQINTSTKDVTIKKIFEKIIFNAKAEVSLAVLLLLLTSLITQTPPPEYQDVLVKRLIIDKSDGVTLSSYRHNSEIIKIKIDNLDQTKKPAIVFTGTETATQIYPTATQITDNEFLISPESLIPKQDWQVSIQSARNNDLDAIWQGSYDNKLEIADAMANRNVDLLAGITAICIIMAILICMLYHFVSQKVSNTLDSNQLSYTILGLKIDEKGIYFFLALMIGLSYNLFYGQHGGHIGPFGAKLEAICAKDGNSMQTRYIFHNGQIHSTTPVYGCYSQPKNTHTDSLDEYLYSRIQ